VIGGGSIGLAVVAALGHLGIETDMDARYPHQRHAAEQLGAHVGLRGDYGIVFDAVGSQSAVAASVRACRSGGSIVELGVFWQPITLGRELTLREISLVPALFYAHDHSHSDFDLAIEIVASRPDIESILVTHVFELSDVAEAVRVAGDRSAGAIKVHLAVGE
jgi:threonine dehydrogenase-like Zn-dependent dehydrogenase